MQCWKDNKVKKSFHLFIQFFELCGQLSDKTYSVKRGWLFLFTYMCFLKWLLKRMSHFIWIIVNVTTASHILEKYMKYLYRALSCFTQSLLHKTNATLLTREKKCQNLKWKNYTLFWWDVLRHLWPPSDFQYTMLRKIWYLATFFFLSRIIIK